MLELSKRSSLFIFLLLCLVLPSLLSAQELTLLQEQARDYRNQGFEYQRQARLDEAMICYQKAMQLDRYFVIAYNDLGIIYEAKGWLDRAERIYLAGLEVNPNYLNLYSNLAMLYEQKEDYKRAVTYWERRIELGSPDEEWVKKAKERLDVLKKVVPELK